MSYDHPNRIKYTFGMLDFGTAGEVYSIKGPKGKAGRIYDYGVDAPLETFTATTLPAYVSVGSVADPDLYGDEISMGTLAVDTGSKSLRTTYTEVEIGSKAVLLEPKVPADTIIALHCTAPTGGTPAGMAHPYVIIDWDN
ncbi:MAG: hypothetical protein AB7O44_30355 [Hyphomicrobiaceae bacterium]